MKSGEKYSQAKIHITLLILIVESHSIFGHWFDPHVRQHSFVEFGHEIISAAILSIPLIQEGQLSVTGERMCTNK